MRRTIPLVALLGAAPMAHGAATLVPAQMFSTSDLNLAVTVWAASPMLRNPSNIDFDAEGRLWVAEAVDYRKHQNRDPAGDRIVVFEDTGHDGKADRSTTFEVGTGYGEAIRSSESVTPRAC